MIFIYVWKTSLQGAYWCPSCWKSPKIWRKYLYCGGGGTTLETVLREIYRPYHHHLIGGVGFFFWSFFLRIYGTWYGHPRFLGACRYPLCDSFSHRSRFLLWTKSKQTIWNPQSGQWRYLLQGHSQWAYYPSAKEGYCRRGYCDYWDRRGSTCRWGVVGGCLPSPEWIHPYRRAPHTQEHSPRGLRGRSYLSY